MHPIIFDAFRNILSRLDISGRVLEIGAVPSHDSLLTLPALKDAERIGVNIDGDVSFDGFPIVACNSNDMPMFADAQFDCVLSNATIEHDPFFWKTLAEVRRVLRPGGVAVIGGPGFTHESGLKALGFDNPAPDQAGFEWDKSALTFRYHAAAPTTIIASAPAPSAPSCSRGFQT